jgi:hypothetical protein
MKPRNSKLLPASRDAIEARYAYKVAARINESAGQLPHDIQERLKAARFQAVAHKKRSATIAAAVDASRNLEVSVGRDGSASVGGLGFGEMPGWLQRLSYGLPLLALLAGLWTLQNQVDEPLDPDLLIQAELDAEVLADELPPLAFLDSGFSAFVKAEVAATAPAPIIQ